jgi:hypothetical protein
LAGMSPHLGISQAPRALPVGLHSRGAGSQGGGQPRRLTNPLFSNTMNKLNTGKWSPTGKPVVPNKHTHLRQGFGGSSAGWRNPPKHSRSIAVMIAAKVTHSSTAKGVVSCVGG